MRRAILIFISACLSVAGALAAACTGADPDLEAPPPDASTTGADGTTAADVTTTPDAPDLTDAGEVPDATPAAECVQPSAASTVLAHTEHGFRSVQGECGWTYRFAVPATIALSSEMPLFVADDGGGSWRVENGKLALLNRAGGHPLDSEVVIRRWTSTYTGDIRVRGPITAPESGDASDRDGVTLGIYRNDTVVDSVNVRGATVNLDRGLAVARGDRIDLVLTCRANSYHDSTNYALEIVRD